MGDGWVVVDDMAKKQAKIVKKKDSVRLQQKKVKEQQEKDKRDIQKEWDRIFKSKNNKNTNNTNNTNNINSKSKKKSNLSSAELEEKKKQKQLEKEKEIKKEIKREKKREQKEREYDEDISPPKPKTSLSESCAKIRSDLVEELISELVSQYPTHPDVQLKRLAEYFEDALSDVPLSSLKLTKRTFASSLDTPLVRLNKAVANKVTEWFGTHNTQVLFPFAVFLYELLFPSPDSEKLTTNGVGIRVVFQLLARKHPRVIYKVIESFRETPPTLSEIPALTWVFSQIIPTSPLLALSVWYEFLYPLLLERQTEEDLMKAQNEAAEYISFLIQNFKDLNGLLVDQKIMVSSVERLLLEKQNKRLNDSLATHFSTLTNLKFLFPNGGVPTNLFETFLDYIVTDDDEIRDQVLSSLFQALGDNNKNFESLERAFLTGKFIAHTNILILYIIDNLESTSVLFLQELKKFTKSVQAINKTWLNGKGSGQAKKDIVSFTITCKKLADELKKLQPEPPQRQQRQQRPQQLQQQPNRGTSWFFLLLVFMIVAGLAAALMVHRAK